jgi:hypothetical protein
MFPGGPNPTPIQTAKTSSKLPLVLLHDGGGTTFGYFFLNDLGRNVWAVHDPHYWDATKWEGGMDQMARHYITLIQNAGVRGKIILGGEQQTGKSKQTLKLTQLRRRLVAGRSNGPHHRAHACRVQGQHILRRRHSHDRLALPRALLQPQD